MPDGIAFSITLVSTLNVANSFHLLTLGLISLGIFPSLSRWSKPFFFPNTSLSSCRFHSSALRLHPICLYGFSLSFRLKYFPIFLIISSLTHGLFKSTLLIFQTFVGFLDTVLLLIFNLVLFWSETYSYIISSSSKFVETYSMALNMVCFVNVSTCGWRECVSLRWW